MHLLKFPGYYYMVNIYSSGDFVLGVNHLLSQLSIFLFHITYNASSSNTWVLNLVSDRWRNTEDRRVSQRLTVPLLDV